MTASPPLALGFQVFSLHIPSSNYLPKIDNAIGQIQLVISCINDSKPNLSFLNNSNLLREAPYQPLTISLATTEALDKKYHELFTEIQIIIKSSRYNSPILFQAIRLAEIKNDISIQERSHMMGSFLEEQIEKLKERSNSLALFKRREVPSYAESNKKDVIIEVYNQNLLAGLIDFFISYKEKFQVLSQNNGLFLVDLIEKKQLLLNRLNAFENTHQGEKYNKEDPNLFKKIREEFYKAEKIPADLSSIVGNKSNELKEELKKIQTIHLPRLDLIPEQECELIKSVIIHHRIKTLCTAIQINSSNFNDKRRMIDQIQDKIKDAASFDVLKYNLLEIKTYILLMNFLPEYHILAETKHLHLEPADQKVVLLWVNSIISLMEQDLEKLLSPLQNSKIENSSLFKNNNNNDNYFNPSFTKNDDL